MHNPELSEQEQIRRNSLQEIRKLGLNPYPPETFEISHKASDVKAQFEKDSESLQDITLAGRIITLGWQRKPCLLVTSLRDTIID